MSLTRKEPGGNPPEGKAVFTPVAEIDRTPTAENAAAKTEREDFYLCPVCGERVDWRDPNAVMAHADHAPALIDASKRFSASHGRL